jgi:hypothetical protein
LNLFPFRGRLRGAAKGAISSEPATVRFLPASAHKASAAGFQRLHDWRYDPIN